MKTLLFILCLGSSISIQANTMNRFEGEENVEESHDWENETETVLFTGLDSWGRSVWGKRTK